MAGWQRILEFPDQSPAFAFGFEAGQLWERMRVHPHGELVQLVNDENRDVICRMARAAGWRAEFERVSDDGWERATLTAPE